MQIPQICPPLSRLIDHEVNVQVPILLLRLLNQPNQIINMPPDLFFLLLLQEVASPLDPLGHIRLPKEPRWARPLVGFVVQGDAFEVEGVVPACGFEMVELYGEGDVAGGGLPATPACEKGGSAGCEGCRRLMIPTRRSLG